MIQKKISKNQQNMLRMLPGVDHVLELCGTRPFFQDIPKTVLVNAIRKILETLRAGILGSDPGITEESLSDAHITEGVKAAAMKATSPNLKPVVNATGVVVHTNLGRSLLPETVVESIAAVAGRYSNLEYDLDAGKRGSRHAIVEDLLCEISGSQAAMAVNNNAGAVLLCLETFAREKEVIVSRGELVEIGGSFRVPDVMAKSGGILKEVGTTNRTHTRDYENAIGENTALLLKVHRSNYSVIGFTAEVTLRELVEIGAGHGVPVMEDLGSGTFIDFSKFGLVKELKDTLQVGWNAGVGLVQDLWNTRSVRRLIEDISWAARNVTSSPISYAGEVVLLFGAQDTVVRWRDVLPECDRPQDIPHFLAEYQKKNFPSASRVEVQVVEGSHVAPETKAPSVLQTGLSLLGQLDE